MFRREVTPSTVDADVLVDSKLPNTEYAASFGYEWQHLDAYVDMETLSHGHLFGRFLLERDYFVDRAVVDVGCGNGRLGRIICAQAGAYTGVDLSESVYAFPKLIERPSSFRLVRASGTDLPLSDGVADITLCWGVLHHMDDPEAAMHELMRITRPGGEILVFVYPKQFDARKNLNGLWKFVPAARQRDCIESISDALDNWYAVDPFFGKLLADSVGLNFKSSRDYQILQWFDGVTPRYHWSLQQQLPVFFSTRRCTVSETHSGCFRIKLPA
jgi:ubiquinone/menaquinone biosynthesis C-methylase UbiE